MYRGECQEIRAEVLVPLQERAARAEALVPVWEQTIQHSRAAAEGVAGCRRSAGHQYSSGWMRGAEQMA